MSATFTRELAISSVVVLDLLAEWIRNLKSQLDELEEPYARYRLLCAPVGQPKLDHARAFALLAPGEALHKDEDDDGYYAATVKPLHEWTTTAGEHRAAVMRALKLCLSCTDTLLRDTEHHRGAFDVSITQYNLLHQAIIEQRNPTTAHVHAAGLADRVTRYTDETHAQRIAAPTASPAPIAHTDEED